MGPEIINKEIQPDLIKLKQNVINRLFDLVTRQMGEDNTKEWAKKELSKMIEDLEPLIYMPNIPDVPEHLTGKRK